MAATLESLVFSSAKSIQPSSSSGVGGDARARGARMLVRIELLQIAAELFQQRAAVRVILELIDALPGDVHRGIAAGDEADEAAAIIGRGEQLRQRACAAGEDQVGDDSLLVEVADARVEAAEEIEIRRAVRELAAERPGQRRGREHG